jgi:hypothetical protein
MQKKSLNDDKTGADAKGHRRQDGASDTKLGGTEAGSGADLASTDMEVPDPSPS